VNVHKEKNKIHSSRIIRYNRCITLREDNYTKLTNQIKKDLERWKNLLSPNCWKCKDVSGTFFHMWWTCNAAKKYWRLTQTWVEQMVGECIPFKPYCFLLGIIPQGYRKDLIYLTAILEEGKHNHQK
uniref:Uncharacterized protein n=1 Tax=Pseudonaja textilis TaxID=8673 RepID=A0A670XNH9_PSETE